MAEARAVQDMAAGDVQPESGSSRRPTCGCRRADCRDALATLATTTDPAARAALRDRIVAVHLDLAYRIANLLIEFLEAAGRARLIDRRPRVSRS